MKLLIRFIYKIRKRCCCFVSPLGSVFLREGTDSVVRVEYKVGRTFLAFGKVFSFALVEMEFGCGMSKNIPIFTFSIA